LRFVFEDSELAALSNAIRKKRAASSWEIRIPSGASAEEIERLLLEEADLSGHVRAVRGSGGGRTTASLEPDIRPPENRLEEEDLEALVQGHTAQLEGLSRQIATHETTVPPAKTAQGCGNIAIVMKKDITGNALAGNYYKLMIQELRSFVGERSNIVEVAEKGDLAPAVNGLRERNLRVIVLDDGTLTEGTRPEDGIDGVHGVPGEDYCVIASDAIRKTEPGTSPFVNLSAMARLGLGVLLKDVNLFALAYEAFTGEKAPEGVITDLIRKKLWFVTLPKIRRIPADELRYREELRKLFAAAA
jgi:hypothetical protein